MDESHLRKTIFITATFFILLCCFWELTSQYFVQYRFILPPLSVVLQTMWQHSDLFLINTKVTLREMAGGFLLALVVAFPLAWTMYLSRFAKSILHPLFVIFQSIPMFTLAPIMVLWFGWSYIAIVVPTALMIFLPLTMNIYQGLISTPKYLLEYFRINQATQWQTFFKLQLPWSLPHIFAGFRISAAFAGIGAIAGEWAGAQTGLGILMLKSRRATDLEITFGALLCLVMISMGLYGVIAYAESRYKKHLPMKFFSAFSVFSLICMVTFISTPIKSIHDIKTQNVRLLLDWLPNSNHVPLYLGIEKKIFAKHYLNLEIIEIGDPSDTIPYITSEKVDLALFYMPDVIKANRKGADLHIHGVLMAQPLNSFIFRADKAIHTPKDLSGLVIGYSIAGGDPLTLIRLLKENQIHPKELRNVNFDLVTLLGTDQVDVIYGAFWNIESEHLRSLGIHTRHFDVSELGHPPYSELVFVGKKNAFQERFQSALQESIAYCKAHPEEAFALYANCHNDKSAKTLQWEKEAWLKTLPLLADEQKVSQKEEDLLIRWLDP